MSMFTRCPHCETVYRVTPQQLQASSGQVRCGRCQQVFDAFTALSVQPPAPGRSSAKSTSPARAEAGTREPAPPRRVLAPPPAASAVEAARHVTDTAPSFPPAAASAAPGEVAALTLPDELFATEPMRERRWAWLAACVALLVALLGQALWFFPGEMLIRLPSAGAALSTLCAWTGCRVVLPRLPDKLFIEASDMQLLDPARPSEVLLTATIRNRAAHAQALPLLELTLTNALNEASARKVFGPEIYLGPEGDPRRGLGANQEISLRLYLDTGAIKPAGYRLYLFFG